jgi:imidazoleglycerol-phosphate dehydratase
MREAAVARKTRETDVRVSLVLEGAGRNDVRTGLRLLDHMLEQWCFHSRCDLNLAAAALDGIAHHVVEDVALALGECVCAALADRSGIARFGCAVVPMDDALARVAVDFSGRPFARTAAGIHVSRIEDLDAEMIPHFFLSFAQSAKMCVHADVLSGENAHHCVEALFKAAGLACAAAWRYDAARIGEIPSTKGTLS